MLKLDRLTELQELKTGNKVNQLNAGLKELVQDPNYDMSQKGEELGSGMFGSVYESKDGQNVIKEGKLSPKEMAILNKLKDVKRSPTLLMLKSPHLSKVGRHLWIWWRFWQWEWGDGWRHALTSTSYHLPMVRWWCQSYKGVPYSDVEGEWMRTRRNNSSRSFGTRNRCTNWDQSQRHARTELLCGWTR